MRSQVDGGWYIAGPEQSYLQAGQRCAVDSNGLTERHEQGRLHVQPQLAGDSFVHHARDRSRIDQEIEAMHRPCRPFGNDEMLLNQVERHISERLAAFHRYERAK